MASYPWPQYYLVNTTPSQRDATPSERFHAPMCPPSGWLSATGRDPSPGSLATMSPSPLGYSSLYSMMPQMMPQMMTWPGGQSAGYGVAAAGAGALVQLSMPHTYPSHPFVGESLLARVHVPVFATALPHAVANTHVRWCDRIPVCADASSGRDDSSSRRDAVHPATPAVYGSQLAWPPSVWAVPPAPPPALPRNPGDEDSNGPRYGGDVVMASPPPAVPLHRLMTHASPASATHDPVSQIRADVPQPGVLPRAPGVAAPLPQSQREPTAATAAATAAAAPRAAVRQAARGAGAARHSHPPATPADVIPSRGVSLPRDGDAVAATAPSAADGKSPATPASNSRGGRPRGGVTRAPVASAMVRVKVYCCRFCDYSSPVSASVVVHERRVRGLRCACGRVVNSCRV